MKTFKVTYDQRVFKRSNKKDWSLIIQAKNLHEANLILKTQYNKNPFYFYFEEIK